MMPSITLPTGHFPISVLPDTKVRPAQPVHRQSMPSVVSRPTAKIFFFWDYDTQWGADRSRTAGGTKNWGPLEFPNTDRLLELHARYSIPACFAVVGSAALSGTRPYHDPAQIRRIHASGHEIASHSHRHEWLPGLAESALRETLQSSKDALEQCIGERVISFVPPFNQPFDYAAGWSFSLAERREAGRDRTDLSRLCRALGETGYKFCRVAYQPLHQKLFERVTGRDFPRSAELERIENVSCLPLNTKGGFATGSVRQLVRCAKRAENVVVYGHPHSICSGNAQDEKWLVPFFERVRDLVDLGMIEPMLPRDLISAHASH